MKSFRLKTLFAASLIAFALLAGGCGDSDGSAPRPDDEAQPVDEQQALVLARLLYRNWERGGATFEATMPLHGTEIEIEGEVDFRSGRGVATLRDRSGQERRYRWTRKKVYAQAAPGSSDFEIQRPDPDGNPVHRAIAFLNLLSAETVDNTVNIIDQGAHYLGRDEIGGRPVDRFRYGGDGRTTYWVGVDDGLLHRVRAEFADGPLTVDLISHGPVRIEMPRQAT